MSFYPRLARAIACIGVISVIIYKTEVMGGLVLLVMLLFVRWYHLFLENKKLVVKNDIGVKDRLNLAVQKENALDEVARLHRVLDTVIAERNEVQEKLRRAENLIATRARSPADDAPVEIIAD